MHAPLTNRNVMLLLTDELMSVQHEDILRKNIHTIADKLSSIPQVLNKLVAAEIINISESEDLLNEKRSYSRATKLVVSLIKRADQGFLVFVDSLRATNQDALANLLHQGEGPTWVLEIS